MGANRARMEAQELESFFASPLGGVMFAFLYIGICDLIICRTRFGMSKSTRWFALHTLINAMIVYYATPGAIRAFLHPARGFSSGPRSYAVEVAIVGHIYHTVFFQPLAFIDWVHHILMVAIGSILMFFTDSHSSDPQDLGIWFLSGFPGGVDYALLALMKVGYIHPLTEKFLNVHIQSWIRAPGLLISCYGGFIAWLETKPETTMTQSVAVFLMILLVFWNAMYFQIRVVRSYYVHIATGGKINQD
eukprot:TRINITY_DN8579_c0_g1::TRINITY_DN8579_c0_g1_i1::g.8525::m.8525 TRINITY_DN8579_c0_g1::TRINITY_DN8579_c0_g1_i1::g.8525  ORF type:complete len:247 (-),score=18.86 TRINITY_DN8579_c0_g1_i1:38-778(-)